MDESACADQFEVVGLVGDLPMSEGTRDSAVLQEEDAGHLVSVFRKGPGFTRLSASVSLMEPCSLPRERRGGIRFCEPLQSSSQMLFSKGPGSGGGRRTEPGQKAPQP